MCSLKRLEKWVTLSKTDNGQIEGKHKLPLWEVKKATSLHPTDFENTIKTYDSQHH